MSISPEVTEEEPRPSGDEGERPQADDVAPHLPTENLEVVQDEDNSQSGE
jgi:hypothetical protein